MKKIKNYIIPLSLLILFGLISCNDTYEFHEKYIQDGEIIYATKVDSLETLPGNGRIKVAGYLTKGFTVNEITVFWNNGENSQTFAYSKSENDTDALDLVVTGLEEKSYEFDVYSKDADGNESVKVTVFGTVYGETYRSNLEARAFNTFAYNSDSSVSVNLKPSSELARSTEIKYTNLSGEEVVVIVLSDESNAMLELVDIMAPIMYRTYYVPTAADEDGEETSIDEFDSDWVIYSAPPSLEIILDSFTFDPILGGIISNWENASNLEMDFNFQNTVAGEPVNNGLTSSETNGAYTFAGMESGEQDVEITVTDVYGNSWSKLYVVTPIPAVLLNKAGWSVIDFSSEEPTEANWGPPIQGSAAAVIDGDLGTFWHSAWDLTQPDYPHHITIDMGAEKTIASFEIFRRAGRWWASNVHEFWISSDNVNWTKVGVLNSWLDADTGYVIPIDTIQTARYVKYNVTAGYDYYSFLAEINIYGLEN